MCLCFYDSLLPTTKRHEITIFLHLSIKFGHAKKFENKKRFIIFNVNTVFQYGRGLPHPKK